ncbi:hypothetical protein K493DRAFT_317279, partial [Basidiobolus meristosporus CBS 931.73]
MATAFDPLKSSFAADLKDCIESRSLSPDQILKITVINIIGLHLSGARDLHGKRASTGDLKKSTGAAEDYLFFFNIEVFILFLSISNRSWKATPFDIPFHIRRLLPSLRLGLRWLINNLHTYTHVIPQFSKEESETMEEFFQQWDEFLYHAKNTVESDRSEYLSNVLLKEDIEVRGFRPLQAEHDVLLQDLAKISPSVEFHNRINEFTVRRRQFSKFESSKYWGVFFKSYLPFSCMRFLTNQNGQESTTEEEISSEKSNHKKQRISSDSSPENIDIRH